MKKIILFTFAFSLFTSLCSAQQFQVLHQFNYNSGGNAGDGFLGGSLYYDGTFLYGMAEAGGLDTGMAGCGSQGWGTIFKIMPNGTGYDTLFNFKGWNGGNPIFSSFISDGTYLYGMASAGDPSCGGSVFKIKPNGTSFDTLTTFDCNYGCAPMGNLVSDGTYLYGMTNLGGSLGNGVIFKIKPNGTGFSELYGFSGTSGISPYGSLIYDGTYLYGMTETAGGASTSEFGTIFKILPNGNNFTVLHVFNDTTGAYPYGSLVIYGAYMYGMAQASGPYNFGVIFKIKTDGSKYDTLMSFNGMNGSTPYGSLLPIKGNLYGMTSSGGGIGGGTIFKIDTAGTGYSILYNFDNTNDTAGIYPTGALIYDGTYLYGITSAGGDHSAGTIFRFTDNILGTGELKANPDAIKVYPNPSNGSFTLSLSNVTNACNIEIYNILGETIYKAKINSNTTEINLGGQSEGVYLYRVISENGSLIGEGKIILQN